MALLTVLGLNPAGGRGILVQSIEARKTERANRLSYFLLLPSQILQGGTHDERPDTLGAVQNTVGSVQRN
jgi:hypothetical protein